MKTKILQILTVGMILLAFIVPASAAGEINYPLGVQNTTVNVSFNSTSGYSFNSTEKSEIMAAANSWQSVGTALGTTRKPQFYQKSTYNTTDGVSIKKGALSGNVIANCAYNATSDGKMLRSSHITFSTNKTWTTNLGSANNTTWDVQSIALHELGHSLGLADFIGSQYTAAVMYPNATAGGRRNLSVYEEYYFNQIYRNSTAAKSLTLNNSAVSEENYLEKMNLNLQPAENYLYLRENKIKTDEDVSYDIELGMDILFVPFDDEELIDFSDLIVKGNVKEISSARWNTTDGKAPSKDQMIEYSLFHDVIVEIDEVYKGELTGKTKEITVRQIGGTFNNVRQTTSVPQFYEGEEVILYLINDNADDNGKSIVYNVVNENGQIFVIEDNLGVNAFGQKVDIQKEVISKTQKSISA